MIAEIFRVPCKNIKQTPVKVLETYTHYSSKPYLMITLKILKLNFIIELNLSKHWLTEKMGLLN